MKGFLNNRLLSKIKKAVADAGKKVQQVGWQLLAGKSKRGARSGTAPSPSALWRALRERLLVALPRRADVPIAPGESRFIAGSFTNLSGRLKYHVFVPANFHADMPLLVMLHGCKQDPGIFAAGTRMNQHAEKLGFVVLYPSQSGLANINRCWNWYKPINQYRDMGEPGVIAGMTKNIISEYEINPHKVYIAGLSAGAAMAYIVGSAYPDLYAAIGVHSGLLYRGINNIFSALAAMKSGSDQLGGMLVPQVDAAEIVGESATESTTESTTKSATARHKRQPLIVFHGDNDQMVHAHNASNLMAYHQKAGVTERRAENSSGPYSHTRTIFQNDSGQNLGEQWIIHGAGHAWSGGSADGNFTDVNGPDASREMLRFFMESGE